MTQMNISPNNTLQFINLISVIKDLSNEVIIDYNKDGITISSPDFLFQVYISKDNLKDYVCHGNHRSFLNTQEMYDEIKDKVQVINSNTGECVSNMSLIPGCYKDRVQPIIHLGKIKKYNKTQKSSQILSKWQCRIKADILCDCLVYINKYSDFMKIKCSSKTVSFIHSNEIIKPETTIILSNNKFKAYINIHNLLHCCNFYCSDVYMDHVLYGDNERILIVSYNLHDIGVFKLYV